MEVHSTLTCIQVCNELFCQVTHKCSIVMFTVESRRIRVMKIGAGSSKPHYAQYFFYHFTDRPHHNSIPDGSTVSFFILYSFISLSIIDNRL